MTDGYQVYHSLEKDAETQFKVAGCWAHARRKFADPVKAMGVEKAKGSVAYEALGMIQYIYRRDNELKDLKPGERKRKRRILIRPLVDDFFRWIREMQTQVSRTSETGKALTYCLNQEPYLRVFLEDLLPWSKKLSEECKKRIAEMK